MLGGFRCKAKAVSIRSDALAKSVARLQNPRHFSQKRRKERRQSSVQSSVTGSLVDSQSLSCDTKSKIFRSDNKRRARVKPPTIFCFLVLFAVLFFSTLCC